MQIEISNDQEFSLGFDLEDLAQRVGSAVLESEHCPYEAEASLTITGDDTIHKLNAEFRGIDRATDVLSFPLFSYEKPADFSETEGQPDAFNPETGFLMLGDIILSFDHARAQAEAYGHSLQREIAFLIAHSMLHLIGYDHMTDEEREVMEEKQRAVLLSLGITRDY